MKQDIYDKQLPEFDGDGTLLVWGFVRTADQEPVSYTHLMSFYEPGTTVQQMDRLADELKHFVIDLFQTLQARGMPCGEPAEGRFRLPLEEQRALSQYVLETIGFDFASGRLDEGSHPTTLAASPGDVRVITSYQAEDFRSGLFNTCLLYTSSAQRLRLTVPTMRHSRMP